MIENELIALQRLVIDVADVIDRKVIDWW